MRTALTGVTGKLLRSEVHTAPAFVDSSRSPETKPAARLGPAGKAPIAAYTRVFCRGSMANRLTKPATTLICTQVCPEFVERQITDVAGQAIDSTSEIHAVAAYRFERAE